MGVFISYSSKDKHFVDRLALALVERRVQVWLDKWEMQAGDSLIDKIQSALTESSSLIVVISKNALESEWCKKELNAGLMRELEGKKSHVIPVRIDDCVMPPFLSDKIFADFRTDFNDGLETLISPLSRITSEHMGRNVGDEIVTDYFFDWGVRDTFYYFDIDLVTWFQNEKKSISIQLNIQGNKEATDQFERYSKDGIPFVMRELLIRAMSESNEIYNLRFYIPSDKIYRKSLSLVDPKSNLMFKIGIRGLQMGIDNNKDILLNFSDYLDLMNDGVRDRFVTDKHYKIKL